MANFIRNELVRGQTQGTSYTPYIVADVSDAPWPGPSAEHTAAAAKWGNNRHATKVVNPQAAPFNSWLLYRLRYILTADLRGAWADFGGISAHLNFISISLRVATTESITDDLIYDGRISTRTEDLGRPRQKDIWGG